MSPDETVNPMFWDWNHVHVPYCSMDQWSGQQPTGQFANASEELLTWDWTSTYPGILPVAGAWNVSQGFTFCGHKNLEAVIDYLKQNEGLDSATQVVLSGQSSGGMGTYINANWLQDQLPNTDVRIAPIAGYFNTPGINSSFPDSTFPLYTGDYAASGLLPFTPS